MRGFILEKSHFPAGIVIKDLLNQAPYKSMRGFILEKSPFPAGIVIKDLLNQAP